MTANTNTDKLAQKDTSMKVIEIHEVREQVRAKLKAEGYSGLYCDGECGCTIDDLMPCDVAEKDGDEEYVNGCESGYKHVDPKNPELWVVSPNKEPPSEERWEIWRAQWLEL